jgi:predicted permease
MPILHLLRRLRRGTAPAARQTLDAELQFHLDMEADHNLRLGYTPRGARAKARRELGDVGPWTAGSGPLGGSPLDALRRDVRVGLRALRRTPAFTAVATLTLAVGIGATTAVFSVVDGVLLRPLPYPQPDRIVRLYERGPRNDRGTWAGANVRDVQAQARTLARVAYVTTGESTVLGAAEPVRARVTTASRELFDVLGVRAARGRVPTADEGTAGGPHVAVVSDAFWRTALGSDPDVTARTLTIGDDAFRVIGIMPPAFNYPARTEVWVTAVDAIPSRTAHNWSAIGRLAPGASVAQANAEVDGILRQLKLVHGEATDAVGGLVAPLHAELTRTVRRSLVVLAGAVAFVLLIGCVNLASAGLARGESREREFAVRAALGAPRGRIVRQVLTESVLLALAGGALGVALAFVLTRALTAVAPAALPGVARVTVDLRVLAFAAGASVLTGLLVGLAPAWKTTADLRGAIGAGGKAGIDGGRLRSRGMLIAAEVALAVALLAGAGLLVRSLDALLGEELGFDARRVLTAELALPGAGYADTTRIAGFYDRLLPAVREIAGVEAAAVIDAAPFSGNGANSSFMVDGGTESVGSTDYRLVDSTYFRALGIPLRAGRGFGPEDRAGAPHVAVVNETAARRYWPGTTPIGHRVRFPGMDRHPDEWLTIVGVVGDVRSYTLDDAPTPAIYIHYPQRPERLQWGATLVVRGTTPPARLADAVRARIRATDPNVPARVSSLEAFVERSVADRRFLTTVLTGFAVMALGLAALGIYGVLAYAVAQRRREIGVRMALGAPRGAVRAMVLGDAMRAVVPGAVLGIAGALALSRLIRGMLYGVTTADPVTFAAVVAVLAAVALLASWLPARRATRVDPLTAIRAE